MAEVATGISGSTDTQGRRRPRWVIALVVVGLAIALPLALLGGSGHSASYDDGYQQGQTLGGDFINILCGGPGCAHGDDISQTAATTCSGSSFSDGTSDWVSGCVAGFLQAAGG